MASQERSNWYKPWTVKKSTKIFTVMTFIRGGWLNNLTVNTEPMKIQA